VENILFLLEKTKGLLPQEFKHDFKFLCHFCNGSPGLIPMLVESSQLFDSLREDCLKTAEHIGEIIWKHGLLLKGNCLCHGVSGNSILLHSLYRAYSKMSSFEKNYDRSC
jgi:hypothetical protein